MLFIGIVLKAFNHWWDVPSVLALISYIEGVVWCVSNCYLSLWQPLWEISCKYERYKIRLRFHIICVAIIISNVLLRWWNEFYNIHFGFPMSKFENDNHNTSWLQDFEVLVLKGTQAGFKFRKCVSWKYCSS